MAPIGTLWGFSEQAQTKVILSVAALNELELEQPEWTFQNKPAEYTSDFSYGKIPAFKGSDGFQLIESASIARYLSGIGTKVNLLGSNPKEIALVDQWIHFAEQEIGIPSYNYLGTIFGWYGQFSREALDKHAERLTRALTHIESYLASRPSGYLVSDAVTLADFILAGLMFTCSRIALGAAERAKYPALYAHYDKVTGDDKVKHLWGKELFTEVAVTGARTWPNV